MIILETVKSVDVMIRRDFYSVALVIHRKYFPSPSRLRITILKNIFVKEGENKYM